jgi:hypothetical protein
MTAKEKAIRLVEKYYAFIDFSEVYQPSSKSAKQCALICVDEILNSHIDSVYEAYYLEVKQEILKLTSYDSTSTIERMGL